MPITITFTNQDINEYDSFEEIKQISNFDLVFKIDCSKNELISLPDNMNFPNLQKFNCSRNELTLLPNINCSVLQEFDCSHNELIALPDNMIFINLHKFNCSGNRFTLLPDNINIPNLKTFY